MTPWGDQNALEAVQRSLNVDILIHGHTYKYKVGKNLWLTQFIIYSQAEEKNGVLYLNPGSLTGAASFCGEKSTASFALLDINGMVLHWYNL